MAFFMCSKAICAASLDAAAKSETPESWSLLGTPGRCVPRPARVCTELDLYEKHSFVFSFLSPHPEWPEPKPAPSEKSLPPDLRLIFRHLGHNILHSLGMLISNCSLAFPALVLLRQGIPALLY
nr:uncharacterized protein LOC129526867 [Gorilla gorilla gorilla]